MWMVKRLGLLAVVSARDCVVAASRVGRDASEDAVVRQLGCSRLQRGPRKEEKADGPDV